jgi:hypothetical protein
MYFRGIALVAGAVLLLGACNGGRDGADTDAASTQADTSGMGGMSNMADMGGMQAGRMEQMGAHMQAMHGASADSMRAMLPMHRQMVANMIAQMRREMRDVKMTADAQWNATVDSLRSDLTSMPEMSAQELHAFMPEHHSRVLRLMDMHRAMMKNLNM